MQGKGTLPSLTSDKTPYLNKYHTTPARIILCRSKNKITSYKKSCTLLHILVKNRISEEYPK